MKELNMVTLNYCPECGTFFEEDKENPYFCPHCEREVDVEDTSFFASEVIELLEENEELKDTIDKLKTRIKELENGNK